MLKWIWQNLNFLIVLPFMLWFFTPLLLHGEGATFVSSLLALIFFIVAWIGDGRIRSLEKIVDTLRAENQQLKQLSSINNGTISLLKGKKRV